MHRTVAVPALVVTILACVALAHTPPLRADGLDVIVEVEGLHSARGEVRGALFGSADDWTHEGREIATCRATIVGARARCVFRDVAPGHYAAALLDDENADGRMERDFLGIPREGYAFSNDASPGLGPPSFDAARFRHERGDTHLVVHTRYGI